MNILDRSHLLEVLGILTHWIGDKDMENNKQSQDIAAALANKFVMDLGRLLVRGNCERARRRILGVAKELTKHGEGYENRIDSSTDVLGGDLS